MAGKELRRLSAFLLLITINLLRFRIPFSGITEIRFEIHVLASGIKTLFTKKDEVLVAPLT